MADRLGFRHLASRLTRYLNELVRRGEVSERGLAHLTGYSQPHIHNVLKGARGMNAELADQLLAGLGVSMMSLFTQDELSGLAPAAAPESLPVPLLAGRLGGGKLFPRLTARPQVRQLPAAAVRGGRQVPCWPCSTRRNARCGRRCGRTTLFSSTVLPPAGGLRGLNKSM